MEKNQIFVKLDEYKEILDIIDLFKKKMSDTKKTLDDVDKIKKEEDEQLDIWKSNLQEIDRKLTSIDKNLFEPQM